jgi:CMP-N-acetylneuraminic acid synthetase
VENGGKNLSDVIVCFRFSSSNIPKKNYFTTENKLLIIVVISVCNLQNLN